MKTSRITMDRDLPEYVSRSIGKPDLGSIANRVRESALLSAQECDEAADQLAEAYGTLLGLMAARGVGKSA